MRHLPRRLLALAVAAASIGLLSLGALAQVPSKASIYACTDAQGRRITSDRPIPACLDREQRELSPSGTVRRVVPPTPTAEELAALEAKRKADAEREARLNDERRRDRALLSRYPNEAAHQRERVKALESVEAVDHAIHKRIEDLVKQRGTLNEEMAFYAKDPTKAPLALKRRIQDNELLVAAQQTALQQQAVERQRVSDRFDAELALLRKLWADAAAQAAGPAPR